MDNAAKILASPNISSEPKKSTNHSKTPSQQELETQIRLSAHNAKMVPNELVNREFDREFSKYSPAAIRWVFEEWRRKSSFFPAVSDLYSLFRERQDHIQACTEKFTSCGSCDDGWVTQKSGSWYGTVTIDNVVKRGEYHEDTPVTGVVRRCHCWLNWVTAKKGKLAE